MKKKIAILTLVLGAYATSFASAADPGVILVINGNPEANTLTVGLSADGRGYEIGSNVALEVGGALCQHPSPEATTVLVCPAPAIGGLEINGGGSDDLIKVSPRVTIPVTLRGETGDDQLIGGSGDDKLIGGPGNDILQGVNGNDVLLGGSGDDWLVGGHGDDVMRGGSGDDTLEGGSGKDVAVGGSGHNTIT